VLKATYTTRFQRDLKLAHKRGKSLKKIKDVISQLLDKLPLPHKYHDHWLTGNYAQRRECHIEPDWLLVYKPLKDEIIFERTGTHSDIFK
jgi:mRNA interferase YafQ